MRSDNHELSRCWSGDSTYVCSHRDGLDRDWDRDWMLAVVLENADAGKEWGDRGWKSKEKLSVL